MMGLVEPRTQVNCFKPLPYSTSGLAPESCNFIKVLNCCLSRGLWPGCMVFTRQKKLDLCLTKYWAFTRPLGIHRQLGADPTPTTARHPTNGLQPAQTGLEPKRHVFRFLSFRQHKQTYRTNFLANRMHMACRCLCTEPPHL